jgi:hypothetical protein
MNEAKAIIRDFFSSIEWSDKGQCHFATKSLSEGRIINILAASSGPDDDEMLIQAIEAFVSLGQDVDGQFTEFCEAAWLQLEPYLLDRSRLSELCSTLELTWIETSPEKTQYTFNDPSGLLGGHILNAIQDRNGKLMSVRLEDM